MIKHKVNVDELPYSCTWLSVSCRDGQEMCFVGEHCVSYDRNFVRVKLSDKLYHFPTSYVAKVSFYHSEDGHYSDGKEIPYEEIEFQQPLVPNTTLSTTIHVEEMDGENHPRIFR